jgi:glycosyltransferase involved in cell wall biosynthesis
MKVAVVMTVRNDADGCAVTLASLLEQVRRPDEIVVVDGGSTDGTAQVLAAFAARFPQFRVIDAVGANIATGRNIGIRSTTSEVIALTDAGCRAEPHWLSSLIVPFEENVATQFVAGAYQIEAQSLLESVVGLATMRGQLEPVDPASFNPSARSMAFTKALWQRAGGFPEWLRYSEDTLFDLRLRALGAVPHFAPDAVVHWRPRSTLRQIARQFYNYGTGRGHTQIGAADFAYNIRNLAAVAIACAGTWFSWIAAPVLGILLAYFYVWTFHAKAARVARVTGRSAAYPLCMLVMWTVLVSNTFGYLRGTLQRWFRPEQYVRLLREYLGPTHENEGDGDQYKGLIAPVQR